MPLFDSNFINKNPCFFPGTDMPARTIFLIGCMNPDISASLLHTVFFKFFYYNFRNIIRQIIFNDRYSPEIGTAMLAVNKCYIATSRVLVAVRIFY